MVAADADITTGLNLVFMGTPEYAVPCLEALAAGGHTVALVVTQPDRPRGRGRQLSPPPVKEAALHLNLPVLQPTSVKTSDFASQILAVKPDALVVVAFGHFLPRAILDIPPLGAVNIHPSLLPAYRGPSPIQWAMVNMETQTGVSSIFMDEKMDAGDIIVSRKEEITPEDTAATLHDRLAIVGADVLVETLKQIKAGTPQTVPQDHDKATFAPLLKKEDGHIHWDQTAERLVAFVRGMTPWPGAFSFLDGKRHKIIEARAVQTSEPAEPGTVLKSFPGELWVAAAPNAISILSIQEAGGKVMDIDQYLRGCAISEGMVFT